MPDELAALTAGPWSASRRGRHRGRWRPRGGSFRPERIERVGFPLFRRNAPDVLARFQASESGLSSLRTACGTGPLDSKPGPLIAVFDLNLLAGYDDPAEAFEASARTTDVACFRRQDKRSSPGVRTSNDNRKSDGDARLTTTPHMASDQMPITTSTPAYERYFQVNTRTSTGQARATAAFQRSNDGGRAVETESGQPVGL